MPTRLRPLLEPRKRRLDAVIDVRQNALLLRLQPLAQAEQRQSTKARTARALRVKDADSGAPAPSTYQINALSITKPTNPDPAQAVRVANACADRS